MVLKLQSGRDFVLESATYKVRRGITQKYKYKSYGSCILHVVMLVSICMKFH